MNWIERLFHRKKLDVQLDKELRFHIDQYTEELTARGHPPDEARRQALIDFGGAERAKEDCREARGTRWLEDLVHDSRYAIRCLAQKPGFAAVALLTLALGSGATTVMFSLIDGVLLKPLPYAHPDRILTLQEKTDWSTTLGDLWAFSYPNYQDCKSDVPALEMLAFRFDGGTVSTAQRAEYVDGLEISHDTFSTLGVHLARGREFTPEDDHQGAAPVAIISYSLWQRLYGGEEAVIGSRINFDQQAYTIVGIAPPEFHLEGGPQLQGGTDIFLPLGQDSSPSLPRRDRHSLRVWGRLRPGATLTQARAQLSVIAERLARQYPNSNKGRGFIADPLRPEVGDARSTLWLLSGAVSLVLLIACVNVASLLLARAVSRERELAVRVALGAGRGRVVRQCLTESMVLALGGGILGVLLAVLAIRPLIAFWPGGLPRADQVQLNWRVLLFALGVSLLCGLLFGLAPALRVPIRHLDQALRSGSRSVGGGSRRLHSSYVISEIALAVILLVSAGVLTRTLLRISALNPGLDVHRVLTARMALSPATLQHPAEIRAAWDKVLEAARAVPGVSAIASVDTVPMREGSNPIGYAISAAELPDDKKPVVLANSVSTDYLNVMHIPLLKGRFFTAQDRIGKIGVAVVDDVMADQAFKGGDPIGKQLWIGLGSDPVTVVGVVGHVRQWGLAADDQSQLRAQLYYPFAQVPDQLLHRWSDLMSIAVRTDVDPLTVVEPLRKAVRGATGDQVIYQVRTMEQLAESSIAQQQFLVLLFGAFAGLALLLACIGIYGVLAYLTSQRIPEIGVRIALGADPAKVFALVMRQSLQMIAAGVVIGALGAVAATRLVERLVEGVRRTEPVTFLAMVLVLVAAAVLASFVPARRASRIDPLQALRQE